MHWWKFLPPPRTLRRRTAESDKFGEKLKLLAGCRDSCHAVAADEEEEEAEDEDKVIEINYDCYIIWLAIDRGATSFIGWRGAIAHHPKVHRNLGPRLPINFHLAHTSHHAQLFALEIISLRQRFFFSRLGGASWPKIGLLGTSCCCCSWCLSMK